MRTSTRLGSLSILAVVLMAVLGGGTAWAATTFFVNSATGSDANDCLSATVGAPGVGPCLTITGAMGKASAGDTIRVAAGTYSEQVQVTKTLFLLGAQNGVDARTRSGPESIIDNACGPVQIMADNVTLDGFTVQGSTLSDPCFLAGIWTNPGFSGTLGGHQILNNIVQNNISGIELDSTCVNSTLVKFNLIRNNNNPGPGPGNGIQTNFGLCNADIVSNEFSGHSNASVLIPGVPSDDLNVSDNELVGGTSERIVFGSVTNSAISGNKSVGSTAVNGAIRLFGGNSNIAVTSNVLSGGVIGIRVDDPFAIGPNSVITAHNNCIVGNTAAGLRVDAGGHSGTLNADNNWWGSATGPTIASNPGGTGDAIIDPDGVVDFTPFLTAAAAPCAAPFRDKRRGSEINVGPDLREGPPATPHFTAINFTGTVTAAGDTWVTVYDETPADDTVRNTFTGSVSLSADVLIAKQNNAKGPGLLALYNQPPSSTPKGLALFLSEAGNTDRLVLATVTGTPTPANPPFVASAPTTLLAKALSPGQILINKWYRVTMDVVVSGTNFSVTGKVFNHSNPVDANSAVTTQVGGSLVFSGPLAAAGLASSGEVGIAATAANAVVNSSVTNFVINP